MADTNTHQDLILLEKKLLERQEKLEEKQEYIKKLQDSLEKKSTEYTEKLEKIASLTRDEAKEELLSCLLYTSRCV